MNPSVSVDAERELIDGALYYARDAGPELGYAFVAEFERSLAVLCAHPHLGTVWRARTRRFRSVVFPTASSISFCPVKFVSLRWRTKVEGLAIGKVANSGLDSS